MSMDGPRALMRTIWHWILYGPSIQASEHTYTSQPTSFAHPIRLMRHLILSYRFRKERRDLERALRTAPCSVCGKIVEPGRDYSAYDNEHGEWTLVCHEHRDMLR